MAHDKVASLLRNAEKHIQHGKIPQAIRDYLEIVKYNPEDVLILNTIGDLYLSQGQVAESCAYFAQVAELYARQKAVPKAITLYKKVVNAQPDNLDAHLRLADLYASQGLGADASSHWLRLSGLYGAAGKTRESREAFEKAVALDATNAANQLKLAEMYLSENAGEKAHSCFAAAARIQAKAGDLKSAADSYRRAVQLNAADKDLLQAYLDISLQLGDASAATDQIRKSLADAPKDASLRTMLGRAYLATGDLKNATAEFRALLAENESFFPDMIQLGKAFATAGEFEQAAACMDEILPILISRRQVDQALEVYNLILESNPENIPALARLAAAYSNLGNQAKQIEMLEKLAECHLKQRNPKEALKSIEEILQAQPDSEKHLAVHRRAFAEAFPGTPYQKSEVGSEPTGLETPEVGELDRDRDVSSDTADDPFVEIDLLVNYGATEKAAERLLSLASRDPSNKEIRRRLLSVYKEAIQNDKAAEQCLILASLHQKDGEKDSAQALVGEAKKLAPSLAGRGFDLNRFARTHGIIVDSVPPKPEPAAQHVPEELHVPIMDQGENMAAPAGPQSVEDQLHQVDFFVRLGFYDEARAKLDQLEKEHPGDPALGLRRQMLHSAGH